MVRFIIFSVAAALSLPAQEGHSANYDNTRQVKLQGPVTRIDWTNPHAYIFINVRDANGTTTNWAVEIGNPLDLEQHGWKRNSVRIGDVAAVVGNPARGQNRRTFATSVSLARTGQDLLNYRGGLSNLPKPGPTPRWPDGQVRLGPPPGQKGYWGGTASNALVDRTAGNIPMNSEGLLNNFTDAGRVAPFLPWAKSVYEYRQRTLLKDDPFLRCLPPGGPRQFQTPHGFQVIEQRELGRILILLGGGDRNWRVVYTDGRPLAQADEVVRGYYGTSVGHWDKDTLIVDSTGFNEKFWFANGGLPHTEGLHLTEKFSRPNLATLKYEVTVDDPRTYARPWTGGWDIQWVAGEIEEYFCEENAESTFIR
jgi:hypothetical protein